MEGGGRWCHGYGVGGVSSVRTELGHTKSTMRVELEHTHTMARERKREGWAVGGVVFRNGEEIALQALQISKLVAFFLEGNSLEDNVYVSLITLMMIGYSDYAPNTSGGRLFATI
ncbi:hypothetical protein G4B88_025360 [Cannabis sativa]|uniref:Potassium channel domain-containing protein n=1 Tax=Cannabis sativa TaxID=3483 RepID=A0A7J6HU09_CANSA|nr:hypothetical protein G4B88_025360 [Cannabis sativa]